MAFSLMTELRHLEWIVPKKSRRRRVQRQRTPQVLEERWMLMGSYVGAAVQPVEVQEGTDHAVQAVFTVRLSMPVDHTVTVDYQTKDEFAKAGEDYLPASGTLVFEPGVTAQTVAVTVLPDRMSEYNEFFWFELINPMGAAIHEYESYGSILDDDPLPAVSVSDAGEVIEGRLATAGAVFTISIPAPGERHVTVNYRTVSGMAQADEDFEPVLGAMQIPPGETQRNVTVSVHGDVRQEAQESFFLEITSVENGVISRNRGTAVIGAEDYQFLVTGAGEGGGPHVCVVDPITHEERYGFMAFDATFTGGVRVATADVNRDGVPDIITAAGPGGGPHVRVFDGKTGTQLPGAIGSFMAYDVSFAGGVNVAAGDLNGDGYADIVTGACLGGGPHVRAFSGLDGSVLADFFAFNDPFTGGVRVAVADMDGDFREDIIAGAGPGGGPHVRVFNAQGQPIEGPLASFMAYDWRFPGGVYVAAGDVNGDRKPDLITGAGEGGGPHVKVFDGRTGQQMRGEIGSFMAYNGQFAGGVRVAAGFVDGDGRVDILTSAGPGGGPHVRAFRASDRGELTSFYSYYPGFTGGAYVAAHGWIEPPPGGIVDPLEVYDAVAGIVLREGVDEFATPGSQGDLWANVWGGTVATYTWDLTFATAAINVVVPREMIAVI